MAKALVAFYNAITDEENANAMPQFYEAFIRGLDESGNDVCVFAHRFFGRDFEEINDEVREAVTSFAPDICFVFNNAFYDLADIVNCPIVIYEVDTPRFFSNKDKIKEHPDRYLFFLAQQESEKILIDEYGVKPERIFYMPFFTEIYAGHDAKYSQNIAFIGSLFVDETNTFARFLNSNPSDEECQMFWSCLDSIRRNPQISIGELIYKHKITSELVARNLNLPAILMEISREKRIAVLDAVADLGLKIYGTPNWGNEYYGKINLNEAYVRKNVYSLAHNQEIYNSSKIGINVSHQQATTGFPWRVMDIMASNACIVTDEHSDFWHVFPELKDVIPTYHNQYEAREICVRLLDDEERRKDIVLCCNEVINRKYRFKHLLPKLEEYSGVVLSKRK